MQEPSIHAPAEHGCLRAALPVTGLHSGPVKLPTMATRLRLHVLAPVLDDDPAPVKYREWADVQPVFDLHSGECHLDAGERCSLTL
jgi:hypothetical protein